MCKIVALGGFSLNDPLHKFFFYFSITVSYTELFRNMFNYQLFVACTLTL